MNTFWREKKWYAETDEVDQYIEKVKELKVMKGSKHSGSQNDMRHFLRQYLFWIKAFADERFPKFKKLSPLTLEEAIKFEVDHIEFWSSEEDVEDLHYSQFLRSTTSIYQLLKDHYKAKWDEYN